MKRLLLPILLVTVPAFADIGGSPGANPTHWAFRHSIQVIHSPEPGTIALIAVMGLAVFGFARVFKQKSI